MRPADAGVAAAYDARAGEYLEVAGSIGQMDADDLRAIEAWRDATPGLLVDAGCGPGLWTELLHNGEREVLGVDISEEFLASARNTYPQLAFHSGSFRDLPVPDATIGGILAWYSLIHTEPAETPAVLTEFARALTPGGSLLIGFFHGPPREPFAHAITQAYFWTAEALEPLLTDAGFTVMATAHRSRSQGEVSSRPHAAVTTVRNTSIHDGHPA